MDQSDIQYIMDMLNTAKLSNDWDEIDEVIETLKEFLDDGDSSDDE